MKLRSVVFLLVALSLGGCIKIEDIPIVAVSPSVEMTTYVAGGKLFATIALFPQTTILVAGNVPLEYDYTGTASMINSGTGTLITSVQIENEGAIQIINMEADTAGVDGIVIIAHGDLVVHAGDKDNTYLTSSPFYGEQQIIYFQEEVPRLSISPSVIINRNISGGNLNATVTVDANPAIQALGNIPIIYKYEGSAFLVDMKSGNQLAKEDFESGGTTQIKGISADTTGIDRMLITASGQIVVWADIGSDGDASNDIYLTSGLFYDELEVIIDPD